MYSLFHGSIIFVLYVFEWSTKLAPVKVFILCCRMHVKHFSKDWNHLKHETQKASGKTGWRQHILSVSVFQLLDSTGGENFLHW